MKELVIICSHFAAALKIQLIFIIVLSKNSYSKCKKIDVNIWKAQLKFKKFKIMLKKGTCVKKTEDFK